MNSTMVTIPRFAPSPSAAPPELHRTEISNNQLHGRVDYLAGHVGAQRVDGVHAAIATAATPAAAAAAAAPLFVAPPPAAV